MTTGETTRKPRCPKCGGEAEPFNATSWRCVLCRLIWGTKR